jgi:hypothetical protein
MINGKPHIVLESAAASAVGREGRRNRDRMTTTTSIPAGTASPARRNTIRAVALAALLATLGACAAGNANSNLTTSAAPATSAAAAPAAPAQTAAAAPAQPPAAKPAEPPQHLTATEINEKCWMRTEKFKADDIDKRIKLVDRCVAEMTKAQEGR